MICRSVKAPGLGQQFRGTPQIIFQDKYIIAAEGSEAAPAQPARAACPGGSLHGKDSLPAFIKPMRRVVLKGKITPLSEIPAIVTYSRRIETVAFSIHFKSPKMYHKLRRSVGLGAMPTSTFHLNDSNGFLWCSRRLCSTAIQQED